MQQFMIYCRGISSYGACAPHTDEARGTGVTAIICDKGATGGVSVRGCAPATRETDLLDPKKSVEKVNAVVLSGGSAFGLEAASGVMRKLYEEGVGYNAGKYKVPIVVGASIYDLEYKDFAFPDVEAGYKAAEAAVKDNFACGATGAAAGATVSKLLGQDYAVKTSLGIATYSLNGIEIAAIRDNRGSESSRRKFRRYAEDNERGRRGAEGYEYHYKLYPHERRYNENAGEYSCGRGARRVREGVAPRSHLIRRRRGIRARFGRKKGRIQYSHGDRAGAYGGGDKGVCHGGFRRNSQDKPDAFRYFPENVEKVVFHYIYSA